MRFRAGLFRKSAIYTAYPARGYIRLLVNVHLGGYNEENIKAIG